MKPQINHNNDFHVIALNLCPSSTVEFVVCTADHCSWTVPCLCIWSSGFGLIQICKGLPGKRKCYAKKIVQSLVVCGFSLTLSGEGFHQMPGKNKRLCTSPRLKQISFIDFILSNEYKIWWKVDLSYDFSQENYISARSYIFGQLWVDQLGQLWCSKTGDGRINLLILGLEH